jgi:hypothetical protein
VAIVTLLWRAYVEVDDRKTRSSVNGSNSALLTPIAVPDKGRFCQCEVAEDVLGVRGECDSALQRFQIFEQCAPCWSVSAVP